MDIQRRPELLAFHSDGEEEMDEWIPTATGRLEDYFCSFSRHSASSREIPSGYI
jgi:hypothetical protein